MSQPQTVPCLLLIDDHADVRTAVMQRLRREFPAASQLDITDSNSFERALVAGPFDVAIIDDAVAWSDGREVLKRLKQAQPACPVIMFTRNTSPQLIVEAMKSQLDDFVVQAADGKALDALCAAVRAALERVETRARDEARERDIANDLRNERNTFQALLNSQPGVFFMFEGGGHLLRWNKQLEEVTGYSSAELAQMNPAELITAEHRQMCAARIGNTLQKGGISQTDADLETKDGRRLPYSFQGQRVEFEGRICLIGVGIDISERKKMENELRHTAEVLREIDQRKNEFLAMLAHELRNPLGPIRNAVQILRKRGPQPDACEGLLAVVDRQVRHMAHLVDDLLDVSRVSRGKILLRRERMDLARLALATINDHRSGFEANGIRLECMIPDAPVWIMGDATRVAQCIGNLLDNALKFTASGGWVRISARVAGGVVGLEFADSGIGIAPEMLSKLFAPFVQANVTIARSSGGLGLGLALVKGLVEMHGGKVAAFSAGLGKGTRISLEFPLAESPPEAVRPPVVESTGVSSRVLIVEDNIDAAEMARMLLEICGHTVDVVHSGTVALEVARRFEPQVVLCDIGLPGGMDGYAVAQALRADERLGSCYLIALSGYGQEDDKRRAREAGFDIHLTKPLDPTVLEELLQRIATGTAERNAPAQCSVR